MLVSIVLPTYNRSHVLDRAIDSVLAQTYTNWELVIVDNHSSDQTDILVKNYHCSKIKFFNIYSKGVIAKQRNFGISNAKGELIAFLDSDDWWSSDKLDKSIKCIKSGADIVYHDLYFVRSEKQFIFWKKAITIQLYKPVYENLIKHGNALTNSSVVVRKTLLERVDGLSEDKILISWEDYDCWLKIAKHTERFVRIKEPLGFYWAGGGNITSSERTIKNYKEFQNRYLNNYTGVVPSWFYYGLGRSHFHLKLYDEALLNLKYSVFDGSNFIRLKSIITIINIYLILMCIKMFRKDCKTNA
jgi:glycosyltransferase involved in cell wall biosynthesis